jgi:transketolase
MDIDFFRKVTDALRYYILKITHAVKSGHPTSSFSAIDLMTVLFAKYLRYDSSNPQFLGNDRVVFSKGHASALFYSLYYLAGIISEDELLSYRKFGSPLEGHPTFRFPHTEVATGSLGQGISLAAGIAWGIRRHFAADQGNAEMLPKTAIPVNRQSEYDATVRVPFTTPRVFVLAGDGELASGQIYEALAWAKRHTLNNLIVVVDVNRFGQAGETGYGYDLDAYRRKFEAFGWGTIVIDGHDFGQIDAAFEKAICYKAGPSAIIAKTKKGKGIPFWEDKAGWHNRMLPESELEAALKRFQPQGKVSFTIKKPDPVISENFLEATGDDRQIEVGTYQVKENIATKDAFGEALVTLGATNPKLIVLDADVANSTRTELFAASYPDRFLKMYIAEQNMASVAVGLSRQGFLPVISTFAAFLSRAHDQIRMMPLSDATVMVNGAYGGVSLGYDGPSQAGLEDLAWFRSLAGSVVLYPADPYQTHRLVMEMAKVKGVSYIRTTREKTPIIYKTGDDFKIGCSKVFVPKKPPTAKFSAVIVAAGITLHEALASQLELSRKKIYIKVIDCYSVKPLDKATLVAEVSKTSRLVAVEDHRPEGGLGEAVFSALAGTVAFRYVHLAVAKLSCSGAPAELLAAAGIDRKAISKAVLSMV